MLNQLKIAMIIGWGRIATSAKEYLKVSASGKEEYARQAKKLINLVQPNGTDIMKVAQTHRISNCVNNQKQMIHFIRTNCHTLYGKTKHQQH